MPVDVEETDDAYIVDVDLPNVNPQDATIEVRGGIFGQYQEREREGVLRRQNRPIGDFEYTVDLPSDIDANRVEAMYNDGVLTVTVGKARSAQPRRIEISASPGRQHASAEGHKGGKKDGHRA